MSCCSALGNFIWFITAGWILGLLYGIVGVITVCIPPVSRAMFTLAKVSLFPFGRVFVRRPESGNPISLVIRCLYVVFIGIWAYLSYIIAGCILCIIFIFFPYGLACFRMARVALDPFSVEVYDESEVLPVGYTVVAAMSNSYTYPAHYVVPGQTPVVTVPVTTPYTTYA